MMIRIPTQKR